MPKEQACRNEQWFIGNLGLELYRESRLKMKLSMKRKYSENQNLRSSYHEVRRGKGTTDVDSEGMKIPEVPRRDLRTMGSKKRL